MRLVAPVPIAEGAPSRASGTQVRRLARGASAKPRISVDPEAMDAGEVAERRSPVRQAFVDRVTALVAEMADALSVDVLATALSKPTTMDTVATSMRAYAFAPRELDEHDRALAAARAEGVQFMHSLLERAGGAYSAEQLAHVLGKAGGRQTIALGRRTNRYFGLPISADSFLYPRLQVTGEGQLLPGLREFLRAFALPDPWIQLVVLMEASPRLEGRSPLQALQSGDVDGAVAVAQAYGSHGA